MITKANISKNDESPRRRRFITVFNIVELLLWGIFTLYKPSGFPSLGFLTINLLGGILIDTYGRK